MTTGRINQVAVFQGECTDGGRSQRQSESNERYQHDEFHEETVLEPDTATAALQKRSQAGNGTKATSFAQKSTSTHQRCGGDQQQKPGTGLWNRRGTSRRNGCGASKPRPQADHPGVTAAGPDRTGKWLEKTSAHRVAAQAPHHPPTRSTENRLAGGAALPKLTLRQPPLRDDTGGTETAAKKATELSPPHPTVTHQLLGNTQAHSSEKLPGGRPQAAHRESTSRPVAGTGGRPAGRRLANCFACPRPAASSPLVAGRSSSCRT